jgi:hypothetical protein
MKKIEIEWLYLGYIAVFFIFIGMLISSTVNGERPSHLVRKIPMTMSMTGTNEDHSMHYTHDHSSLHPLINVSSHTAPKLSITMDKDSKSGWHLYVQTENFIFTPNKANEENDFDEKNNLHEGHAHIYVNGTKLTRLYAKHYYLSDFLPGKHVISVSLNTNNHLDYAVNDERIFASVDIIQ